MKNKKWSDDELISAINYIKEGKSYEEIALLLNRTYSSIRTKLIKNKEFKTKYILKKKDIEYTCLNCEKKFKSPFSTTNGRKFCSSSCSAIFNNLKREVKVIKCINCNKDIFGFYKNQKYCSQKCQKDFEKNKIVEKIESGDTSLYFRQYKSYLINKYGEKCMECGWYEINSYTNKIPIELEHIDGNSYNNSLDNLKLLCPNCHSLTKTYKGANVGNGRHIRRERYKLGKSF